MQVRSEVSTPQKLGIVADDLTGLQAVAAEFGKFGLGVRTVVAADQLAFDSGIDVLGIDTQSRHLPSREAAAVVHAVVARLRALGVRHVYKQTDSGLQGPLAAEIEAAMRALGAPGAVHAPSCPGLRRVMQGGRQSDETGLDVDVSALWLEQTGCTPAVSDADAWGVAHRERPSAVWLADAQTDAQLHALVSDAWPLHAWDEAPPWLLAGSVGLAGAVACQWRRRVPRPGARPVLVVAGSQQAQTQRQIEVLVTATDALMLDVTDRELSSQAMQVLLAQARSGAAAGCHVVVVVAPQRVPTAVGRGGYPLIAESARQILNLNLRRVMATMLAADSPWPWAGLLIAGGNTADLLARDVLRVLRTQVSAWLAPGVAGAVAELAGGRLLPIVTKAGTWGDTDVLLRGIEWIVAQDLSIGAAAHSYGRSGNTWNVRPSSD